VAVRPAVCAAGAVSAGGATRPAGPETGGGASPADFSAAELGDVEQPAMASSAALKKVTINAVNLFPWKDIGISQQQKSVSTLGSKRHP
jgi:hypothetical protein